MATPGPAKSWWQFEIGGVAGVLTHRASSSLVRSCCDACYVVAIAPAIHRAIEGHDVLAAGLARLLLWTDPHPLPQDEDAAWECYERCWRPGAPDPVRWQASWATALQHVPKLAAEVVA